MTGHSRADINAICDIAGRTACCGNPGWPTTHAAATRTAPVVTRFLDAGAALVGNVAAPGRVAGGSSSGSAAAVAALARLPQLSLPLASLGDLPIGLGLIAAQGGDEMLLTIAEELAV